MMTGATILDSNELAAPEVEAVLDLVGRAKAVDGAAPLNEAAVLHLRHPRPQVQHLLARSGTELVGYAQLEGGPESSVGQLVVDPDHRRLGIGALLMAELIETSTTTLQVWAVGDTPAAQALAARAGLIPGRTLAIMQRSLTTPWPDPPTPAEVEIRAFRPGQDEQAWLAVNARGED